MIQVDGAFAAVSAVALCSLSMTLAVGDERGLVRSVSYLYFLLSCKEQFLLDCDSFLM